MRSRREKTFMDYVQDHERRWGTQSYRNRPDLQDILAAKVVVFWSMVDPDEKQEVLPTITLHNNLDDIEEYLSKIVVRAGIGAPTKRIFRIYKNKKLVRIKDVKITFEESD